MQRFTFKAYDSTGKVIQGEIEAEDQLSALSLLHFGKLSVADLQVKKPNRHLFQTKNFDKQVAFFFRQLAILNDNSTTEQSLEAMKSQRDDKFLSELTEFLHDQILAGKRLYYALDRYNFERREIFSNYVIGMVRVGEESGRLSQIFKLLADFLEKEFIRREKFQSALIYPKILFTVAMLAFIFMITFILPSFAILFDSFNGELPLPTRILLTVGDFAVQYGFFSVLIIFSSVIMFEYFYQSNENFRLRIDTVKLKIPIIGKLEIYVTCMYIFRALSVMLQGGLKIDEAADITKTIPANRYFRQILNDFHLKILNGMAIPKFFDQEKIFPRIIISLIYAGYRAGKVDEMFEKCGEYCELNADTLLTRMQAMIEPMLLIFLATMIFFFVISIVMPMLDLMSQIGG